MYFGRCAGAKQLKKWVLISPDKKYTGSGGMREVHAGSSEYLYLRSPPLQQEHLAAPFCFCKHSLHFLPELGPTPGWTARLRGGVGAAPGVTLASRLYLRIMFSLAAWCWMKYKIVGMDDSALMKKKERVTHLHPHCSPFGEGNFSHILEHFAFNQNFTDTNFLIVQSMDLVRVIHL